MTFLFAVMTAMTLLFTPAADADCKIGTMTEFTQFFKAHPEYVGGKMAAVDTAKLIAKMGPPPGIEGDFDLYRYTTPDGEPTVLFIVQGGCVEGRHVVPTQMLDNILGDVNADNGKV